VNLKANPFFLNDSEIEKIESTVELLSDEEKIGQLFCIEAGKYSEEELESIIKKYNIGGFLFRPTNSAVLKEKCSKIQQLSKIPLLIAANLETGGAGAASDKTLFANPMGVAATNDISITKKFAKVCATEGLECGINWSFSPVVDININPQNPITNIRAFSDDTETVIKNACAFIEEMQNEGMAACCKHFPGDGVDFRDQHLHPTYNTLSCEDWYRSFGKVYKSVIEKGTLSIMAGHICQTNVAISKNSNLLPEEVPPASLCKELLVDVLRKELNFNGVITTDATVMAGYYQEAENREDLLPLSIVAGCDMLLFVADLETDYNAVLEAYKNGVISEQRLNEAVSRILALKMKVCKENKKEEIPSEQWQQECANRAVTLVKNNANLLPITNPKAVKICIFGSETTVDGDIFDITKKILAKKGIICEQYDAKKDIFADEPIIIFGNYQTGSGKTAVRIFWDKRFNSNYIAKKNVIFVSLGNPYLLQDIPRVKTYINAYSPNKATIEAVLSKILGESEFVGKSPIDAFCGLIDTRF